MCNQLLFTDPRLRGFSTKAYNCLTGSAWHSWQTQGAYFVNNSSGSVEQAATIFARGKHRDFNSTGAIYSARRKAFIEGTKKSVET